MHNIRSSAFKLYCFLTKEIGTEAVKTAFAGFSNRRYKSARQNAYFSVLSSLRFQYHQRFAWIYFYYSTYKLCPFTQLDELVKFILFSLSRESFGKLGMDGHIDIDRQTGPKQCLNQLQYTLPIRMPLYRMYLIKEYDKEIPNRPRSRQRINLSDNWPSAYRINRLFA